MTVNEDVLDLLERVLVVGVGEVSIEYVKRLCWSCDIHVHRGHSDDDVFGHGTGSTVIEAIDDALVDVARP